MADISSLISRIDAEFSAMESKVKDFQSQQLQTFHEREKRQEHFEKLLQELPEVWRPRLDALAQKFGQRVNVTPEVEGAQRSATFRFQSPLARIDLRFSVFPDRDVRQLICTYNLDILPIYMKYDSRSSISFPLENVDRVALGKWIDDRIVDFVKTYMALHENGYYLKDHLVEDPVAKVQLPKYAAAARIDWRNKTYYFISEETRREFEQQQGIVTK
jgi:YHS domain-containing protein